MSGVAPLLMCLVTGCATLPAGFTPPWKEKAAKVDGPKDSLRLTGRGLIREPIDPMTREQLDAAKRLFDEKNFADAERLYAPLARADASDWWRLGLFDANEPDRKSRRLAAYEEALFHKAECQRLQKNYRDAVDSYTQLLVDVRHSQYTRATCAGLFDIADHWLEPTRKQMDEYQAQLKGERWFVTPAMYVHFNKEMPWMDAEGHACKILNTIRDHDINGPMGEKALFYLGTVNFFRKEYKEADFYFTQLYQHYPNSKHSPQAIKQSVICKQLVTGGTVYDLRTVEESKKLLLTAQSAYPELVKDDQWVENQLKSINIQQADRDFKIAEFYERTGHPGSAFFYYELVCRRYPGTNYAAKAQQQKVMLRSRAEKEQSAGGNRPPLPLGINVPMLQPGVPLLPTLPQPRMLPPGLDR